MIYNYLLIVLHKPFLYFSEVSNQITRNKIYQIFYVQSKLLWKAKFQRKRSIQLMKELLNLQVI